MRSRQILLSQSSLLALLALADAAAGCAALAADVGGADLGRAESQRALPAVSGVNAKIGSFGASISDQGAGGGFVGVALPLGQRFGAQLDGVVGTSQGGHAFRGAGGHLFWRDPARALFGIYASDVQWDNDAGASGRTEVGKVGFESQLYLGRLSLEGLAAYQFGSESGVAGKGTLAFYPLDDLRLHLGVTHYEGPGYGAFTGLEWAPRSGSGMSLFADVGVNEDRDVRAVFGLKFYLARGDKPLIRRHREDDPDVDLPSDLFHTTLANQPSQPTSQPSPSNPCPPGQTLINGFCDGNT